MKTDSKIFTYEKILNDVKELKKQGKKIVLCHGHFNVIHPGHLRFLNFAKKQGDYLVLSILNPKDVPDDDQNEYFSQRERAQSVAALEMVDAVYELPSSVLHFIKALSPDFYVKGREFEKKQHEIQQEMDEVEKAGGKVIFSSGEVEYTSFKFTNKGLRPSDDKKEEFLKVCAKHEVKLDKLSNTIDHFQDYKILVIGDTIVDQFVACDSLGVSSEAPVLAIRELESREFIGGAAIVAQHVHSLGAQCHYLSVIGDDHTGQFVQKAMNDSSITNVLLKDKSRPTTFKIRYMVENQKLLRVSRLKQHEIDSKLENKIIQKLEEFIPQMHGIVICDFVYGVITEKVLSTIVSLAKKHNVKVYGDLQCSSQVGDVSRFKGIELITPTEKEARIAMGDHTSGLEKLAIDLINKTNNQQLVITLGGQGILAHARDKDLKSFHSEFFPALESNPVDLAGAGDSLLAGYVLSLSSGLNIMEASALASCLAGISVMRIGNLPITKNEVKAYLNDLGQYL